MFQRTTILLTALLGCGQMTGQTFTKVNLAPFTTDAGDTRGVIWGDIDNDGDPDLYLTNVSGQSNFLYLNQNGTFVKNDTSTISLFGSNSGGGAFGDYDKDGDLDLLLYESTSGGNHVFFRNDSSYVFTQLTNAISQSGGPGRLGAWADYDNDGHLDLFIALDGNTNNLLFHSNGNGTFTQVTTGVIVTDGGNSRGGGWCDYDLDGDMDLFVPNYLQTDFLYRNDGGGTFTKITTGPLVTTSAATFGASWGDLNNDGWMDLYVTNYSDQNALFLNDQNGGFSQVTGLNVSTEPTFSNSAALGDLDCDGDLDICIANGDLTSPVLQDRNDIFLNNNDGTYTFLTNPEAFITDQFVSQAVALADYDLDGYLDAAVSNRSNQLNQVYNNVGGANSWVQIKLQGIVSNAQGIGARLELLSSGTWQTRQVLANSGYRAQSDVTAHFGLSGATVIDSLIIYWPSGEVCRFDRLPSDSIYTFIEGCSNCSPLGKAGITSQKVSCPGDTDGSLQIFGYPDSVNYLFSLDSGGFQTAPVFSPLAPGAYTIELVDEKGCKYTYSGLIEEPDSIVPNAQSTPTTNPSGNNGTAWVTPTGGTPPYDITWSTGAKTDTITNLTFGTYFVTVIDFNGCESSDTVQIERGIVESLTPFPDSWSLDVFPNPTEKDFRIEWNLPGATDIRIRFMDAAGREISQHSHIPPFGTLTMTESMPAGTYFLIMEADDYAESRKIISQ